MRWTRRDLLRTGAMGAAAMALPRLGEAVEGPADFTVAFFTDTHVNGHKGAAEGLKRAVDHAMSRPQPPELLLTGGDLVMDILDTGVAAADRQYDLFDTAFDGVGVPVHHCLGNHDCLGVSAASPIHKGNPLFGKGYSTVVAMHIPLFTSYWEFDFGWEARG